MEARMLLAQWQGGGDQLRAAVVGVGVGGLALGVLGYLYFREWLEGRRVNSYRVRGAADEGELAMPGPGDGSRKPLVEGRGLEASEAGGLRGMVAASAKSGAGRGKAVVGSGSGSGVPGWGTVNLGEEDGAHEIRVDGEFVGMTPAKLRLVEGAHVIEVGGYRREISVVAGSEVSLWGARVKAEG